MSQSRFFATSAPRLLPPDLIDFVGRTAQVAEITDVLRDGPVRLVVLAGPAGTGKSALAVHLAHRLRADFPDGRVHLRTRNGAGRIRPAGELLAQLAAVLGVTGLNGHPGHDSAVWRFWLHRHRALVVLDDAVDETMTRALAPRQGDSAMLVTARHRLPGLAGAYPLEVPRFSQAEAVELLAEIVGAERVAADRAAVADILAATGRLPLAVRVGGLRLAAVPYLSMRDFADRLSGTRTVLDELVTGALAARPRVAESWYGLLGAQHPDADPPPGGRDDPADEIRRDRHAPLPVRLYARELTRVGP
ncbi:ATP-binding protein [Actinoplanes sp. NPDC026623]|uniref:ATP-binding protein n=1 Tax=Actinoplanes sp. NPDC026623 TaxID=3155610 RepID=UPI0033FEE439